MLNGSSEQRRDSFSRGIDRSNDKKETSLGSEICFPLFDLWPGIQNQPGCKITPQGGTADHTTGNVSGGEREEEEEDGSGE